MRLNDVPLDLLQEVNAALDRYVQARRKSKLYQERARLQEELQDVCTDLAEIQALSTHPVEALHSPDACREGVTTPADQGFARSLPCPPEEESHV